jgi:predicted PurR-regulated permease PerM
VVVLLSLMLWGTLWGVPGLVLAVPLTAVLRIHLAHVDHPLPRCVEGESKTSQK